MTDDELREQLTWDLIKHCSIPRYHEDGTENWDLAYCPTCGAEGLYGPNSPDHARHQADALLPLIREHIAKAEAERDQAKKDLRSTRSELVAAMDQLDEVHRRAENAEQQRDENLQNVRKVEDLRMAEIGQLSNTINTLRSYAEARSKSTSEAVRLTAEGVLQILDREATDGTR